LTVDSTSTQALEISGDSALDQPPATLNFASLESYGEGYDLQQVRNNENNILITEQETLRENQEEAQPFETATEQEGLRAIKTEAQPSETATEQEALRAIETEAQPSEDAIIRHQNQNNLSSYRNCFNYITSDNFIWRLKVIGICSIIIGYITGS